MREIDEAVFIGSTTALACDGSTSEWPKPTCSEPAKVVFSVGGYVYSCLEHAQDFWDKNQFEPSTVGTFAVADAKAIWHRGSQGWDMNRIRQVASSR